LVEGVRIEVSEYSSAFLARFVFQACLIDRSSISPFRINELRTVVETLSHTPARRVSFHQIPCGFNELHAIEIVKRPELCHTS
jgi:hypothetical protein